MPAVAKAKASLLPHASTETLSSLLLAVAHVCTFSSRPLLDLAPLPLPLARDPREPLLVNLVTALQLGSFDSSRLMSNIEEM